MGKKEEEMLKEKIHGKNDLIRQKKREVGGGRESHRLEKKFFRFGETPWLSCFFYYTAVLISSFSC